MTGLQTGIYPVAGPGRLAAARPRPARGLRPLARAAVPDRARRHGAARARGRRGAARALGAPAAAGRARSARRCASTSPACSTSSSTAAATWPVASAWRNRARPTRARRGSPTALVGNDPYEPLLELTVRGPSLTALRPVRIAIAGPAVLPWVGGQPAEALADARPRHRRSRLAAAHRPGRALVPRDRGRDRERPLHGQREHRRARARRAAARRRRRPRHGARGRLRAAHERARRLARRRRDGAHPARARRPRARRSSGSTAPSCARPPATARACGSRAPRSPAASR